MCVGGGVGGLKLLLNSLRISYFDDASFWVGFLHHIKKLVFDITSF